MVDNNGGTCYECLRGLKIVVDREAETCWPRFSQLVAFKLKRD